MWSWKVTLNNKATDEEIVFQSRQEYSDRVFACQTLENFLLKMEIPKGFVVNASMIYVETENKGG